MPNPTIKTIAKEAGVSVATVSKALNDMPDISDGMKERIRAIAAVQGYTINTNARQLASGHSHSVGTILPDITDIGWALFFKGLFARLSAAGYSLYLNEGGQTPREQALLTLDMMQKRVGVLVVGFAGVGVRAVEETANGQIPVICAGGPPQEGLAWAVACDEAAGGRLAARHLFHRGHRHCRVFTPGGAGAAHNERVRGFVEYMRAHGCKADTREAPGGISEEDGGMLLARQMTERNRPHTAIFATSDDMALGAMAAFKQAGHAVPENISIIGYGDTRPARLQLVNLTTVRSPCSEMGICAGDMAAQLMRGETPPVKNVSLEPELVSRATVRLV